MRPSTFLLLALSFVALFAPFQAHAQSGAVGRGLSDLVEFFARSGAKETAEQLAEIGGERAVRELLEKAAREGGDDFVGQVVILAKSQGPMALKAIEGDPVLMTKALGSLPERRLIGALAEAGREPQLLAKLVKSHGAEALALSAKHPGNGILVISRFGDAGLEAARQLDDDGMLALAKVRDFDKLPKGAQEKFLKILGENPKGVNQAIKIAAAGTGLVLTADFVNKLEAGLLGADGVSGQFSRQMDLLVWCVVGIIAGALIIYAWIKLFWAWRKARARA